MVLQRMRRHVRLGRLGVWGALATGPLALVVAMTSSPTVVQAATPKPAVRSAQPPAADPSGYAELFLSAWLRSSTEEDGSAQSRIAQSMAPSVALPEPARVAQPQLADVRSVRSARTSSGEWWVTVAAQYADGTLRYFAVPVVAGADGESFSVPVAPGRVAGPRTADVPASAYAVSVPVESELAAAAGGFLRAYLTGTGDVDRFLAPGVSLAGVASTTYSAVEVESASAVEEAGAAPRVPADGTRVRLRVSVQARDKSAMWPLTYELQLSARAGRWEVAALLSGGAR
ncbi:conjugal transfer protein [Streptomyces sp. NPDC004528]|uniref:conjugal transfer protein n=1 Tax=Streptomyces sp. NPDC004528 TaxID=3154550 RepID=UPI0033A8D88B